MNQSWNLSNLQNGFRFRESMIEDESGGIDLSVGQPLVLVLTQTESFVVIAFHHECLLVVRSAKKFSVVFAVIVQPAKESGKAKNKTNQVNCSN